MKKEYKISDSVVSNCRLLIEELNKREIQYDLCGDTYTTYTTSYGTKVFDWEIGNDIFSLEVGKDTVGYFIEIDGKDTVSVDSTTVLDPKVYSDLKSFLSTVGC